MASLEFTYSYEDMDITTSIKCYQLVEEFECKNFEESLKKYLDTILDDLHNIIDSNSTIKYEDYIYLSKYSFEFIFQINTRKYNRELRKDFSDSIFKLCMNMTHRYLN